MKGEKEKVGGECTKVCSLLNVYAVNLERAEKGGYGVG